MKKLAVLLAGICFCGIIGGPPRSWAEPGVSGVTQIAQEMDALQKADKQIYLRKQKIVASRNQLETDVLSQQDRQSLRDQIAMYRDEMNAYKHESQVHISILRAHWSALSDHQRDIVTQAQINLE